jgi:predicted RNase H-like nuclease (RuvC/YqgF family)
MNKKAKIDDDDDALLLDLVGLTKRRDKLRGELDRLDAEMAGLRQELEQRQVRIRENENRRQLQAMQSSIARLKPYQDHIDEYTEQLRQRVQKLRSLEDGIAQEAGKDIEFPHGRLGTLLRLQRESQALESFRRQMMLRHLH